MLVDVHLITAWTERALDVRRPLLPFWGVLPTENELAAMGTGFAAIRSAVLGEHPPPVADADTAVASVPDGLQRYLHGMAAGIEAAGADTAPMTLVAGLVAGAAQLQFAGSGSVEASGAAESAAAAGVAAADLAGDDADLGRIVTAAAEVAVGDGPVRVGDVPSGAADERLRALIAWVLSALAQVAGGDAGAAGDRVAGCGAGPAEHSGRLFLAEVTFQVHVEPAVADDLARALGRMGTDLRIWPDADTPTAVRFHLHTRHPDRVVAEVYGLATPFDLRIGSLEPPVVGGAGQDGR